MREVVWRWVRFGVSLGACVLAGQALGEESDAPVPRNRPAAITAISPPDMSAPSDPSKADADLVEPIPYAPAQSGLGGAEEGDGELILEARVADGAPTITRGLVWRIYGSELDENGELPLIETVKGGTTSLQLPRGRYVVHATYGQAMLARPVDLSAPAHVEQFSLDVGGLRLAAFTGEDTPLTRDDVDFEVHEEDAEGLRRLVLAMEPGEIARLRAGRYHVVSRYGDLNAVVRADIDVQAGKLTDAMMKQRGAEITLKLVSAPGGEALADTSWRVTTSDGETLHESVGAFPSLILAGGEYRAIAVHHGRTYARVFGVVPGPAHDVELILAEDVTTPDIQASRLAD